MQNPRYAWGVMTHYLADWQARVNNLEMTVDHGTRWSRDSMWKAWPSVWSRWARDIIK